MGNVMPPQQLPLADRNIFASDGKEIKSRLAQFPAGILVEDETEMLVELSHYTGEHLSLSSNTCKRLILGRKLEKFFNMELNSKLGRFENRAKSHRRLKSENLVCL